MPAPDAYVEATGFRICLTTEAPQTVKKAALEAYDRWAGNKSSLANQIGGMPYLEPLRDVIRAKATTARVGGSLISLAEGAWPTQESLAREGLADSPLCTLCTEAVGTLYHKFRTCRCLQSYRLGKTAMQAGLTFPPEVDEERAVPLFRRGVAYMPQAVPPVEYHEEAVLGPENLHGMEDLTFTGQAGSDGSLVNPKPFAARRGGGARSLRCKTVRSILPFLGRAQIGPRAPTERSCGAYGA